MALSSMSKSSNKLNREVERAEGCGSMAASEIKKTRKRAPGGGRKRKAETFFKEAISKYHEKLPEVTQHLIAKALGEPQLIACPKCKHEWPVNILGTGDKDCLIHIDNRVQGKPVAKTEVDLAMKHELSSSQAIRLLQQLEQFKREYQGHDLETAKETVKQLPSPLTPQDVVAIRQENELKPQDIEESQNTDYEMPYAFGEAEPIGEHECATW